MFRPETFHHRKMDNKIWPFSSFTFQFVQLESWTRRTCGKRSVSRIREYSAVSKYASQSPFSYESSEVRNRQICTRPRCNVASAASSKKARTAVVALISDLYWRRYYCPVLDARPPRGAPSTFATSSHFKVAVWGKKRIFLEQRSSAYHSSLHLEIASRDTAVKAAMKSPDTAGGCHLGLELTLFRWTGAWMSPWIEKEMFTSR